MFIDTHSHLQLGKLADNIPEAIRHLEENNFSHSIQIGTSVESSQGCIELAKQYPLLRATVGIHPCEAQDMEEKLIEETIKILESMILSGNKNHIVGVGEIGLDYYHLSPITEEAKQQKEWQYAWFKAQADLALKYDLPVVIHTRNCPEETLEALRGFGLKKFVIHCFSENWDFAEQIFSLSEEAKISFTGILTYPNSSAVHEVAQKSPLEKIMIETDAPYIIPQQMKGKVKYCEPAFSRYVFETLCSLRTESKNDIESMLWKTSADFFRLS